MSTPETFLKELYQELSLGFKRDYKQVVSEIETFERIFKDKKWKPETKKKAKDILVLLYKQRDNYAAKAKHYRALYNTPEGASRSIGWRKSRT